MSDNHTGLSHDMPEYVPNWPLPVKKVKARVYKASGGWSWSHSCPHTPFGMRKVTLGFMQPTQPEAFAQALKHARGCW